MESRNSSSPPEITADVVRVPLSIVNLYLYGPPAAADRSWVLIDAGLSWSGPAIRAAAEARFGRASRPAAVILTHGHFDHVGALRELSDLWDTPVYAHEMELPYLTGGSAYPPPDPAVGGGAMSFLSRLYPRGPIDLGGRVYPLPADGSVPHMPGWRWIPTPGHTAGHVSLFRDADRVLIVGDAFVTQKQESALAVITRRQEVRRPPAYYTSDWGAARQSVERLAALYPEVAATGHGVPMRGEQLRRELSALLRDWDRVAVPAHGRYVRQPAVTDERGTRFVPPPVIDPQLLTIFGVGLAAAGAVMLLRGQRNDLK